MTLKRLQFVHLTWLLLVMILGVSGLLSNGLTYSLLAGIFLAALPGMVGAALFRGPETPRLAGPLLVITWTLLAVMGVAATGAALSPLTILFAIAPLVALNLGMTRMAAEASVFGAIAYVAAILMVRVGLLPPIDPAAGHQLLAMLLAFAALVVTGLLTWTFLKSREAAVAQPEQVVSTEPVRPTYAAQMPGDSGILLLDITAQGRIRTVSGDAMGLKNVHAGGVLTELLADDTDTSVLQPANSRTQGELELINGRVAAFVAEAHDDGTYLVLRDLTETRAKVMETKAALEAAESRLKGRTAFFASLGHDLKTPLNAILGYADLMRAGIRGPMPEPYADYPEIIHESGQDLLLLVDDILDLAKADADRQRLEPEPVDLNASAQSVLRQLENQADRNGVKLKLKSSEEVWAEADARAVRQIWQNLVSNAIKYSERGSNVLLDAYCEGNATVLSVADKGAGMTEDDIRRVLEPFAQGSNSRGRSGTGLGLAVVKSFAELHGGIVRIESKPGKGTKVEVTLPRADPADIQPMEDAAE